MAASDFQERLGRAADGELIRVEGAVEPASEPLRAVCTQRPCVAFQANVALTTPGGPDVIVVRQAQDFWLAGEGEGERILVRVGAVVPSLRSGQSGGVHANDEVWRAFRKEAILRNGVTTNWYEEILPLGQRIWVDATVERELAARGATGGYRDAPRVTVLHALRIA